MPNQIYFVATEPDPSKAVADKFTTDVSEAMAFCKESNVWAKKNLFHAYEMTITEVVDNRPVASAPNPAKEETDLSLLGINQKLKEHLNPEPVRRFTPRKAIIRERLVERADPTSLTDISKTNTDNVDHVDFSADSYGFFPPSRVTAEPPRTAGLK